jgi:hypothetical protein
MLQKEATLAYASACKVITSLTVDNMVVLFCRSQWWAIGDNGLGHRNYGPPDDNNTLASAASRQHIK